MIELLRRLMKISSGTPLAGEDIRREVEKRQVITRLPEDPQIRDESFRGSAYDFHVGFIAKEGSSIDSGEVSLEPGAMGSLATQEHLNLPYDISALIIPRDRPAKAGLLILNAGHIDPGHQGFVTAQVINLSTEPFTLIVGASYFSVVFYYLTRRTKIERSNRPEIERRHRLVEDSQRVRGMPRLQLEELSKTFVRRDQLNWELLRSVLGWGSALVIVVAAIAAILRFVLGVGG